MQDGGTSLLEETARKQGESDGDQDDGTSRSDGDQLLSSSPDQVMPKWMCHRLSLSTASGLDMATKSRLWLYARLTGLSGCFAGCLLLNVKLWMGNWLTGITPAGLLLCLHTEVLFLHQLLWHAYTPTGLLYFHRLHAAKQLTHVPHAGIAQRID